MLKRVEPMLVVRDLARSRRFYQEVMGQKVLHDWGANVVLEGGFALQSQESWLGIAHLEKEQLSYGGHTAELYFESEDFDGFVARLKQFPEVECLHGIKEQRWGQRGILLYDPDRHLLEVGESLTQVIHRFAAQGMTPEQIALRMDVELSYVLERMPAAE